MQAMLSSCSVETPPHLLELFWQQKNSTPIVARVDSRISYFPVNLSLPFLFPTFLFGVLYCILPLENWWEPISWPRTRFWRRITVRTTTTTTTTTGPTWHRVVPDLGFHTHLAFRRGCCGLSAVDVPLEGLGRLLSWGLHLRGHVAFRMRRSVVRLYHDRYAFECLELPEICDTGAQRSRTMEAIIRCAAVHNGDQRYTTVLSPAIFRTPRQTLHTLRFHRSTLSIYFVYQPGVLAVAVSAATK